MRVLHVINQLSSRGGAEVSLRDLIVATEGNVHHGVAVLHPDRNTFDEVAAAGAETFAPPRTVRGVAAVRHVRHVIEAFRPDVIGGSLFDAAVAARMASPRKRPPTLITLVNTPYAPEARIDRHVHPAKARAVLAVDRLLSRHLTAHFHAITEAVADAAVRDLRVQRDCVTVIPRGRDARRYRAVDPVQRADIRRRIGVSPEAVMVLCVGREEAQKGHTYLWEAARQLARLRADIVFVHAGRTGTRTDAIESLLRSDPLLAARVRRLGVRSDVAELMASADVFVFPSLYEGLGVSVIEAMACRTPIIAGDSPAVREVLADGACGVLVPVADAAAVKTALSTVLTDPGAAARRAEAAHRRFLDHYELQAVASRMVDLWAEMAGTPRAARPRGMG